MKEYAFGVDVGGTTVKIGLFNSEGYLLDKWEIPTNKENYGASVLPDIADSIRLKMDEKDISMEEIEGVGIGAPGAVNREGTLVNGAVNIGWGVFNIPDVFERYFEVPVIAANDANAAAYGEMLRGGGRGFSDLVMVTLGTGVGGGIISNGEIVTGVNGVGGEIGHLHVEDYETEECGCRKIGCLEQYASATGIVRLANRRLEVDDKYSILREGTVTAKAVFDAVKVGDELAIEVAEEFGNYLGKGLALVATVVNPEVFVIGGGVSKAGKILLKYIEPAFKKYVFAPARTTHFTMAKLGNDAGIYGAAGLILNKDHKIAY